MSSRKFKSMSTNSTQKSINPFISLAIVIVTLFVVAFLQMEERRMGYQIFQLSKINRNLEQDRRIKEIELAKLSRPSHIMSVAKSKLTLKKAEANQIIHIVSREKN